MTYPTAQLEGRLANLDDWAPRHCSLAKALDVIGTRSALLLLRESVYGVRRFDDFVRRLGLTDAVVAARLRELVDLGVLEKMPYREPGQRARSEYVLTQMGVDLVPALLALLRWGDVHLTDNGGPIAIRHADCGAPVEVHVRCDAGHEVPLNQLSFAPAPRRRP